MSLFDLDIFGSVTENTNTSEDDIMSSNIDEEVDFNTIDSTEFIESLKVLVEDLMEFTTSEDLTEEEFTESTAVTRKARELQNKYARLTDNYDKLKKKLSDVKGDKTKERLIQSTAEKILDEKDHIERQLEKMGLGTKKGANSIDAADEDPYFRTSWKSYKTSMKKKLNMEPIKERQPGELKKLHNDLKKMTESIDDVLSEVDEMLEDVNITVPGGDTEKPKARPYDETPINSSGKKEISEEVYNCALKKLQSSYKESAEIVDLLLGADRK